MVRAVCAGGEWLVRKAEDPDARALGRDDDPADVQRNRRPDEQDAQGDEKRDRLLAPCHLVILGIQNAKFKMQTRRGTQKRGGSVAAFTPLLQTAASLHFAS